MGKKRMIDTDFWTDSWVVDHLNPLDAHLFMYLFTNPQTNLCGVYKLSIRIMSFQLGIEKDELLRMLKRLEPKVYYIDGWIILRNGIKNQNYRNVKIKTGILAALEDVPPEVLQRVSWPKDFGNPKPQGSKQTQLIDDSSMTHDESLHLNETKTESKTKTETPAEAVGGFNKLNKAQKRNYALAVRADEALAIRAGESTERKGSLKSGYELAKERVEAIKHKSKN
jgi:hypothetical protein